MIPGSSPHNPVLLHEVIAYLQPCTLSKYVDCTLGAAGHASEILQASSPQGQLLGLDVDPQAMEIARSRLASFGERAHLRLASYVNLINELQAVGWEHVDGILVDLGVSSMQLDQAERGFSFRNDAPLDMRFNPQNPLTAATLINQLDEKELADLIFNYGEERRARHVARMVVRNRPILSTLQLAGLVAKVTKSGKPGIHAATRTFQALRIAVNQELESIEILLPQTVEALVVGGRLAVITFHSLEDRLVKHFFQRESRGCICPPQLPLCTCEHRATLRILTRKAVIAGGEENQRNPRARSARLRVVEKMA